MIDSGTFVSTYLIVIFFILRSCMEDLSVDTSNLERAQILTKRGQCPSSTKGKTKLQLELKNSLEENHSIHSYLGQLTWKELKDVSFLILNRNDIRSYDRIKKMIAIDMFKNFLRAPLATLIWKIPKKSQFDNILQKISENPRVDGLSQEIDDITLTKILLILKIARYYPNKFYQKKTKK